MKIFPLTCLFASLLTPILSANPADEKKKVTLTPEQIKKSLDHHRANSIKLSLEQDELSADVQDLIDEQSDAKVVKLLAEIEEIMAESTDLLEKTQTGGETLAVQTEVIEKIFEAAKKKQQSSGGKKSSSMLDMMKNMMNGGKDVGKKPSKKSGQAGNNPGGGGGRGGSSSGKTGSADTTLEGGQRRVPKSSGNAPKSLPREFQKAMEAYNKGASKSLKRK